MTRYAGGTEKFRIDPEEFRIMVTSSSRLFCT